MESQNLLQDIKESLKEILFIGKKQVNLLIFESEKQKVQKIKKYKFWKGLYLPAEKVDAKIITEPKIFRIMLLERYWKLYEEIIENIELPIIQFLIRPLLEFTYSRIIWFGKLEEEKQKSIATKYWLCSMGLFSGKEINSKKEKLTYSVLLDELNNQERKKFKDFQNRDFPSKAIHKELYNLFTKLTEENLPNNDYLINIFGNLVSLEWLEKQYRSFSLYSHVNIFLLKNLEKEKETKSHLFKCFSLILLCGMNVIEFTNRQFLKNKIELDSKIMQNIKNLLPQLIRKYSNLI